MESKIPLVGFAGERVWPLGEIDLDITIGEPPCPRTETLDFVVVRSSSPYNLHLGRPAMERLGMVVSTIHAMVKFHSSGGIGTILSKFTIGKQVMGIKKVKEEEENTVLTTSEEGEIE